MGANLHTIAFLFQNSNGTLYNVRIDQEAWTGTARAVNAGATDGAFDSTPQVGTDVSLTVDAGSQTAALGKNASYFMHMSIFNTTQSLNDLLTA